MLYYRIKFIEKKKGTTGIRELSNNDIDYAWRYYEKKTFDTYHGNDGALPIPN